MMSRRIIIILWTLGLVPSYPSSAGLFDRFFYYPTPRKETDSTPKDAGKRFEEFDVPTSDGQVLNAWWIFPDAAFKAAKGCVLQFHGNARNISNHFWQVAWLADSGYEVMVFDYRGYGRSTGRPSHKGLYSDGLAALDAFQERCSEPHRMVVVGQSLGGAVGARALVDWSKKSDIKLLILDSTFHSYRDVANDVLPFLAKLLLTDTWSTSHRFEDLKGIPTLVTHAENDPVVQFRNGREIYDRVKSGPENEFWHYPGKTHIRTFSSDQKDPLSGLTFRQKLILKLDSQ